MKIETIKELKTVEKIKIPVYAALYEVRSGINENAPKIGRQKCEKLFDVWRKLEDEIDALYADDE